MTKLVRLLRYLKQLSHQLAAEAATLSKIRKGKNSFIELPYFDINYPAFVKLGHNTSIGKNAWLSYYHSDNKNKTPELLIGNNVRIGNHACITFTDSIAIEDGCLFSDYIYISDHAHGLDPESPVLIREQPLESKGAVVIGANSFLGMRVTVLPGVTLGHNCIVGAHSVVTKSYPPYSMLAGVPAKLIKRYSPETKTWEDARTFS